MNNLFKFLILTFFFVCVSVHSGEVEVIARLSPAGTIEIKSDKLLGQLIVNKRSYRASKLFLDVSTLDSGVELRDQHIHKYLNNNGTSQVSLENIKIDRMKQTGTGRLHINGVKRKINFKVEKKENFLFTSFNINKKDYNLPKASYMGISVRPELELKIKIFPKDITKETSL
jgi:hypothetical protein